MHENRLIGYSLVPIFDKNIKGFRLNELTNCTYCGSNISTYLVEANICIKCVEDFMKAHSLSENTKTTIFKELINLGFELQPSLSLFIHNTKKSIKVEFHNYCVNLIKPKGVLTLYFNSPTWQNDLLSVIKERIS